MGRTNTITRIQLDFSADHIKIIELRTNLITSPIYTVVVGVVGTTASVHIVSEAAEITFCALRRALESI